MNDSVDSVASSSPPAAALGHTYDDALAGRDDYIGDDTSDKDAARYRWLRSIDIDTFERFGRYTMDELDKAVDSAMRAK